jgi:hypothetical protein
METSPNDTTLVGQRNSYAFYAVNGVIWGAAIGGLTILPTSILGFLTLPLTGPIVLWKVID